MQKSLIVAIDGPVASGKGTIAPRLAERLHGFYLYTGAMYRSLALYCIQNRIDFSDTQKIISVLPHVSVSFSEEKVFLNGNDVTEELKDPEVAKGSSPVAVIPEVRTYFVSMQQKIAQSFLEKGIPVIAEGRDTATKVFPHADLKIFLTATPEVRARRRLEQQKMAGNQSMTYQEVLEDTKERDKRDSTRSTDPLVPDPQNHGYFIVDSSPLTEQETLDVIIAEVERHYETKSE